MRKGVLLVLIGCLITGSFAQTVVLNPLKKADDLFEEFSYANAIPYYKSALDKGENERYITTQIAFSYRNLNMTDSAETWFRKVVLMSDDVPLSRFYLGEALMSNGKYDEAKFWFEQILESDPENERVKRRLNAISDLGQFDEKFGDIIISKISANSPALDFSPAFSRKGVVFLSSRPKSEWVGQEFNWDQSGFLDLYEYNVSNESVDFLSSGLNTKYHEGPLCFFDNYRKVVYTRNNYDGRKLKKDANGVTNLKIFFAEWSEEEEKWINEQPFLFNKDEFSNGAPTINDEGNVLIFSSDRPGGYGESDLYISIKNENKWSEPRNLGKNINTKGRDGFPFLDNDRLIFASDGREGLGGLDLYEISFTGNDVIGEPENLGTPFNSNGDDFGLIEKNGNGYFTSNREKINLDDIYFFSRSIPDYITLMGEVYNQQTDQPILDSDVIVKAGKKPIAYTRSGENGVFTMTVPASSVLNINAGKFNFQLMDPKEIETDDTDTTVVNRIYLVPEEEFLNDSINIPDPVVIEDDRIKPYEETAHFVDEFVNGDTIKIQLVYFALDSYLLSDEYKESLDEIAEFLIEHVDVKVLLASHADSRSSLEYNKKLSQKRGDEVAAYLEWMGVDMDRMVNVALGEKYLTNDCGDDIECEENQHQSNRRTEIILIKTEDRFHN